MYIYADFLKQSENSLTDIFSELSFSLKSLIRAYFQWLHLIQQHTYSLPSRSAQLSQHQTYKASAFADLLVSTSVGNK